MPKIRNIIKRIRMMIDKISSSPSLYSFIMSDNEIGLFTKHIKSSKNYLEFGTGGSTFHVLKNSSAVVYSVDSSPPWFRLLRTYRFIRKMERLNRLHFLLSEIGPVKEWGHPVNEDHKELFPAYSSSVFKKINCSVIDTVLVDGRFRVACILKTILECGSNESLKILVHDFWNRPEYHIVLKFVNEIDRADTLAVFTVKRELQVDELQNDYEAYKYVAA